MPSPHLPSGWPLFPFFDCRVIRELRRTLTQRLRDRHGWSPGERDERDERLLVAQSGRRGTHASRSNTGAEPGPRHVCQLKMCSPFQGTRKTKALALISSCIAGGRIP